MNDLFFFIVLLIPNPSSLLWLSHRNHHYKSISLSPILGCVFGLFFPNSNRSTLEIRLVLWLAFSRFWLICGFICDCVNVVRRKCYCSKNTLFCIYLRNRLLLFLLLSVFYHKIYVLNVIAAAKSHVNFISFVFRLPFLWLYFSLWLHIYACSFARAHIHSLSWIVFFAVIFSQRANEEVEKKHTHT